MNSISSFGPGLNSVPKHYILTTSTELKSGLINPNKFVISRYISASHLSIINQSKDYSWSTSVKMPCHPIPFEIIIQGEMNTLPSIESMPMPFDQISGSLGTTQIPGMPGVRCPTCLAKGEEVWVIPGRACGACGTGCWIMRLTLECDSIQTHDQSEG